MSFPNIPEIADLSVLGDVPAGPDGFAEPVEPTSEYRAEDPSGSLWVSVDPRGRLVDVEISRTWTERLAPESFADVLFSTYTAALQKAALAAAAEEPPRPRRPRQPEPRSVDEESVDEELSPDAVLAKVDAAMAEMDAALRAVRSTPDTDREEEIRGRYGYLTLRLRGGVPVGITGSPAVANASRARLREDVFDIFHDTEPDEG